ncbi:hypothetical protein [Actinophytocola xanthii]|uniref:Uncharacterized protein n=1 Tax=Actinophytocola xanthii TaxID=1912961 RepID=A0A1Q8CUX2_9PSEU|nr:hypothetical protein [Actinophytocola xanthii]OLF18149.1 hypothetical protein BU204_08465 [Actinophytocola xanthii]
MPVSARSPRPWGLLLITALVTGAVAATPASAEQTIGFPTFTGPPPAAEPVPFTTGGTMGAIYDAGAAGTDFWMDRLLARRGADPAGSWLMTRGGRSSCDSTTTP